MAPILLWLILVLCLLISVVKYVMGMILRLTSPGIKIQKDFSCEPTVSVLMPCYNEGKTVYETIESISKSNYPSDKFEVIAQDDCSVDDSYEWMLKAQRDFTNIRVRTGRNEANSGKARSVCNALQLSTAEIIISIDSDCIFDREAIRELTSCFAEPHIGSVGGRVGVRNPNDGVITTIQTIMYYFAFQLYKIPENWTRSVGCISGCLFAVRRELLLEMEPAIRSRHWFGVPVNQGEDRFLTHQTLLHGYGTYINNDALCWTTVPNTLSVLFKQQLRWRRSIVRDFFFTLRTLPQHVWKLHPNTILTLMLVPLGALVGLLVAITMLTSNPLAWAGPVPVLGALGIAAVLSWVIKKYSVKETLAHPLAFGAYVAWSVVSNLFLTPLALCTMDSADWGTRTKRQNESEAAALGNTNR
ncbi:MAG TPA: glycosyltransferase family 2 protein [Candidatus Acidoferrales bacterium]|nr:glycosyltransferase family 2 protein [Candidatus Acidoferrales bacterium]